MKRLLFAAVALLSACAARAVEPERTEFANRLQTCEAIMQDTTLYPDQAIPSAVLRQAKGLLIVNQVQVSLVLGIKDGWGVAMVRKPNGQWSLPAFIEASELSFGLQAGGKSIETIYLLMDDASTHLLFKSRFKFGVDAKAVAGPAAAEAERSTKVFSQVLVYSNVKGFYAGATVKTGTISPLIGATQKFYGTHYDLPELLFSDWVKPQPEAQSLMNLVQKMTQ